MKYLEQKLSRTWWTKNIRYFLYFIREFSGVLIALFTISFIAIVSIDQIGTKFNLQNLQISGFLKSIPFQIIEYLGLAGAVIHTLTWLSVMPKISPIKLPETQQKIAYLALIAVWLGISLIIISTIHAGS
jgi:fumarate reductase subunit C